MNKKPLLTKLQRYTAYCIMLAEAESEGIELGLCHLSGKLFDLFPLNPGYNGRARDKFGWALKQVGNSDQLPSL